MFLLKYFYLAISFLNISPDQEPCCQQLVFTNNQTSQVFTLTRNPSLSTESVCPGGCIYTKFDDGDDEYCFQVRTSPNISPSECSTDIEPSIIFIELQRERPGTMTHSTTYTPSRRSIRTKKRYLTRTRQSPSSNLPSN